MGIGTTNQVVLDLFGLVRRNWNCSPSKTISRDQLDPNSSQKLNGSLLEDILLDIFGNIVLRLKQTYLRVILYFRMRLLSLWDHGLNRLGNWLTWCLICYHTFILHKNVQENLQTLLPNFWCLRKDWLIPRHQVWFFA